MSEAEIRKSVVNGSRRDAATITLPGPLADLDWETRDFLGWRDAKLPLRGYAVLWRGDEPLGIILRAAAARSRRSISAMCDLCQTGHSGDDVTLFTAKRAGQAGRDHSTVGTYVCADLACSRNVRQPPPPNPLRPDPDEVVAERVEGLWRRLNAFAESVLRP